MVEVWSPDVQVSGFWIAFLFYFNLKNILDYNTLKYKPGGDLKAVGKN